MNVLIIGAGGHAQVVADILLAQQRAGDSITPIGYLDDDEALQGREFLSLPVLGPLAARRELAHDAVLVAIGDNQVRRRLFEELLAEAVTFATATWPARERTSIQRAWPIPTYRYSCTGLAPPIGWPNRSASFLCSGSSSSRSWLIARWQD